MPSLDETLDEAADAVELDLSGSVDFDDVPNGTYVGKLTKVEPGKSKDGGNPMLLWYFDVEKVVSVEGDEPVPAPGAKLPIVRTMLDGKGAWRTKKLMKALGLPLDTSKSSKVKFSPAKAKGSLIVGSVRQQDNNPEYQEFSNFKPYVASTSSLDDE